MASPTFELMPDRRPGAARPRGRTVVVGHDGSPAGMAVVGHAARRAGPGGYVIVVHALPLGVSPEDLERDGDYVEVVSSLLDSVDPSDPDGPSYETRVVVGPASQALLETAQRYNADEIVLGAAANRRARGAIGRVSDAVLRNSTSPVTIVPPRSAGLGAPIREPG
jgi:nucleotide-binding universal stress UspA family protein